MSMLGYLIIITKLRLSNLKWTRLIFRALIHFHKACDLLISVSYKKKDACIIRCFFFSLLVNIMSARLPLQSKVARPRFQIRGAVFGDDDDADERIADEKIVGIEDNKITE